MTSSEVSCPAWGDEVSSTTSLWLLALSTWLGVKGCEAAKHMLGEHRSLSHCVEESFPAQLPRSRQTLCENRALIVLITSLGLFVTTASLCHPSKSWQALGDLSVETPHSVWLDLCFHHGLNPVSLWKTLILFPNLSSYVCSEKRNHKILQSIENNTWPNTLVLPTSCCLWKPKEL